MKWYWILAIIVGAIIVIYAVAKAAGWTGFDNDRDIVDQISCRPGTCPGHRTDGSIWCSSAFCKKAVTSTNFSINNVLNSFKPTPTPGPIH